MRRSVCLYRQLGGKLAITLMSMILGPLCFSERIWLSGKTLDCRPRDCEFDPPSLQLKLLKKEICTGSSQEKCSRVSVLYTGHVKEPGLSCVVGAPVSCTMGH